MRNRRLEKSSAAIVAVLTIATSPLLAKVATVTDSGDTGDGTFRAAVEAANADASIGVIVFSPNLGAVALQSSVVFTGGQDLAIEGKGVVVEPGAEGSFELLACYGGGDLSLEAMTFRDSGGVGVLVDIPDDAAGTVDVTLSTVTLADNGLEGILIDDCDGLDLDTCEGSAAGVDLLLRSCAVTGNGRKPGVSDIDGIRINERGDGTLAIMLWVKGSSPLSLMSSSNFQSNVCMVARTGMAISSTANL